MFNVLDQLFNPGRRHTEDEEHRLQLTRDEEGNGDPGRGPIDLESGAVIIRPPRGPAGTAHPADSVPPEQTAPTTPGPGAATTTTTTTVQGT
ncbi:DUF6191 domain-containing protein [Actinacidiphila yeochonensis]|uniref:DUF6191 domain-containing protein n=1 Tax=Actinacidiphila yeochonensis TaxID=89050 RepID=UPI00056CB574|nr:DUF6191 domain-containing protein [Actinacidiphila yeochonensis]